jgi:hypothetical protein
MTPTFRWLVSAENTPYMAWQCWLFRHSARTRCGVEPTFVLHRRAKATDELFDRMASEGEDYFVLFDPDMLFVRATEFLTGLTADRVTSLGPRHPSVREALDRAGLAPTERRWLEDNGQVSVGVPYVIPR